MVDQVDGCRAHVSSSVNEQENFHIKQLTLTKIQTPIKKCLIQTLGPQGSALRGGYCYIPEIQSEIMNISFDL